MKIAEMSKELDKLNEEQRQKNAFVKHMKKMDERNIAEYKEELGPHRRRSSITKKPGSPSKYESASVARGSLLSKRETFKGFKKIDLN